MAASPRRADLEATLRTGGYIALVDGPAEALAVANVVAPEHLELLVEERRGAAPAGAQRRGGLPGPVRARPAWATTWPGPTTSCPRPARRASPRRCGSTTSAPTSTPCRWTPTTLARLAPHVVAIAQAEGLPAHAQSVRRARRAVMAEAPSRCAPTSTVLSGYHSPQVDVEVRLNTNESPLPPPPEWLDELRDELGRIDFNRYPDRDATALRAALARVPRRRPGPGVLRQRVQRGPAVPAARLRRGGAAVARVRADLRAAQPHRLAHRHRGGARLARPRPPPGPRRGRPRSSTSAQPVLTFLCSPNNPTGRAESPEVVAHVLERAPGLVVVDEAYGQFAPWSALDLLASGVRRLPSAWWWCGPSPRRGRWRPAVSATSSADPDVVAACEAVVLPVPPRRHDPGRGAPGPAPRRRHGGARGPHHRGAGPHRRGARPSWRSSRGPRTPTSSCSGPPPAPPPTCGRTSWRRRCWCATARAGPGSTTASGSRWGRPRRTTGSWPRCASSLEPG